MHIVLASHLPSEGHFKSDKHLVVPIACWDDFGYWHGLVAAWDGPETIVNVEHDVEITDEHIDVLLDCPHSLCGWLYPLHWISTHQPVDVLSASSGGVLVTENAEWADWSAIGFVKITAEARTAPLRKAAWGQLEQSVAESVRGPWHLHRPPLNHWHW